MTRIKICGLTRPEDVLAVVDGGADALGFVFYPPSKRYVTPEQAGALRALVPPFVTVVALFVNPVRTEVEAVLREVRPHLLQFHGDESAQECMSYGHPWLKALRVPKEGGVTGESLARQMQDYARADGCLLDTDSPGYGGSGTVFDHGLLDGWKEENRRRLILSGGLNEGNIGAAIQRVRPVAVDVSSGVEDAPGIKNALKIRRFIEAVRAAQA
ncbi:phosphoribosylanthranilate isomerase [Pseudomonas sp. S 311-6]|nr:phosphoribosylanthranilate isomerase [Kerstersia gyiorum]MCO7642757.1 phosphoribosylanthranilate isomerase [Pseudomonas sp. S 311-6]MCP1634145.1 phosphoribosylanthranilate isomerase [Kerstersia gyiorum]MCP1637697.1 phosphoribosylanthranilate isomerase [Kerstersia gyiorum]MCP1670597.1 phosphoribosylanthranilate isomerase [Kerstersia gyiorum]MCP1678749.1 phosphoribosylanthranilate isomerase [Kerstersia gyiorum]